SPMRAFLVSTKVPILPSAPRYVPGRRYANGPTLARAPITASVPSVRVTRACSPTSQSVRVVSGPITAPVATTVARSSRVCGRTTVWDEVFVAERYGEVAGHLGGELVSGGAQ